jgi:hypothetical protein
MVLFYILTVICTLLISQHIFVGDEFSLSYHLFTYTGLILLCGIIIVCTSIIVSKVEEIKDLIKK